MLECFLAARGGRAGFQHVKIGEADIRHEVVRRRRESRTNHALCRDPQRSFKSWSGIGQVFIAVDSIEGRRILRIRVKDKQVSGRNDLLLVFWLNEEDL